MIFFLIAAALVLSAWPSNGTCMPRDGPGKNLVPWRRGHLANPLDLAFDIEVFAQCLVAGVGIAGAMSAVGKISPIPAWSQAAALLRLGVSAPEALQALTRTEGLKDLATLIVVSKQSGAAIANQALRQAQALRGGAQDRAQARAERAGIFISLPLTLCFLPAFIILGLVPIVVGLGTSFFS